jgi:hypothetical protein
MGRENIDNWHVSKCAKACDGCKEEFRDKQVLHSRLFFDEGEYTRQDFCEQCAKKAAPALSSWKTVFIVPPPPTAEVVQKESAESLLRKLLAKENEEDLNAIFILMVMLERKKIFVERDTQKAEDGRKLRIYEHKKTGESFIIIDPELKLDQLEHVQEEVVVLLGGQPRNAEPEAPVEDSHEDSTDTGDIV